MGAWLAGLFKVLVGRGFERDALGLGELPILLQ